MDSYGLPSSANCVGLCGVSDECCCCSVKVNRSVLERVPGYCAGLPAAHFCGSTEKSIRPDSASCCCRDGRSGLIQNWCWSPGCQNLCWEVQSSEPGNLYGQIMLHAVPAGWVTCCESTTCSELSWPEGGLTISAHQVGISFPKRVPRQVADAFFVLV